MKITIQKSFYNSFYKFFLFIIFFLTFQAHTQTNMQASIQDQNRIISFYEERDLELFESPNKSHAGVWKKFDQTQTSMGKKSLQDFFKNPTSDIKILKSRQNIIQKFLTDTSITTNMTQALQTFGNHEHAFTDIQDLEKNAVAQTIIASFYFDYAQLQRFNTSPLALDIKNTFKKFGLFSPLLEHVILHFALEHIQSALGNNNNNHDKETCDHDGHHHHDHHDGHHHDGHVCIDHIKASKDSSLLVKTLIVALKTGHFAMHVIGFKEMIEHTQQQIAVINELYKQLVSVKTCLESLETLDTLIKKDSVLQDIFGTDNPITKLFVQAPDNNSRVSALNELIELLSNDYFDNYDNLSFFSSIGKTLRAHKLLHEAMPELQPALAMVGQLDAYLAVATKLQTTDQIKAPFCFVNFLETNTNNKPILSPVLSMKQAWNIMLERDHVVTNNISLGNSINDNQNPSKIIITGPNKTGKSSLIKALALNIIFAQTFGIAAATHADMTIFHKVLSYITITDDILNDKSMLVAEILRADQCLKDLKALKPNEFAFVVIDDSLFKGTTYEKGQEAAYQFIKEIGTFNNSIACIATHLPLLTKLETEFSQFANYRIKIGNNLSGGAFSTFTLERGISSPDDVFRVIQEQGYTSSWL